MQMIFTLHLQRRGNLPLSQIGRINAVKMNTLPKFLYLFQCIPTFLSQKHFNTRDKYISAFIWNNKHPRICKDYMQRSKPPGGLALPNMQFYYWAANVINMLYWQRAPSTDTPAWLHIE